jgi:hypothetical protein
MAARGDDWPTRQLARPLSGSPRSAAFHRSCAHVEHFIDARGFPLRPPVHLVVSCRDKRRQVATGAFLAFEIASFRSECRLCVRFTVNSTREGRPPEIADEYLYLCPCRLRYRGAPRPIA